MSHLSDIESSEVASSFVQDKLLFLKRLEKERALYVWSLVVLFVAFFASVVFQQVFLGFAVLALAMPIGIFSMMTEKDFKNAYLDYWQAAGWSKNEATHKYYNDYAND